MKTHHRPLWIIIFAILLASIAIRAKGQGLSDATTGQLIQNTPESPGDQVATAKRVRRVKSTRPQYAFVSAELAQFDSDADPDGWIGTILLLDSDDQPTIPHRANAKFEMMPRVPTHDFTGYVNANVKPITWSMPLKFGDDGSAKVRLKLDKAIQPLIGWPSTSHPAVGNAGGFYSRRRGIIRHTTPGYDPPTSLSDLQRCGGATQFIGVASFGQLKVRVSVPGRGVFDAVTPVTLRPSVLVDTRWPYQ